MERRKQIFQTKISKKIRLQRHRFNRGDIFIEKDVVNLFENFKGKIIWSADGISLEEIIKIIKFGDFPKKDIAIKLDRLFLTRYGLYAIGEIQKLGVPVFADAKIVEIPSKTNEIAKLHLDFSPWMLNVMADVCSDGIIPACGLEKADELAQFAQLCKNAGTKSCAVTILTSKTEEMVQKEYGKSSQDAVEMLARLAIECGITDIVCSPLEAKIVRAIDNLIDINTPGVRLPESSADDQSRIMTPNKALENGATRLVIGRDLSRDNKFTDNYFKIMANIEGRVS